MPQQTIRHCALLLLLLLLEGAAALAQGSDYAFIFYNTRFSKGWGVLPETEAEAKKLAAELRSNYNFKVELHPNLTYGQLTAKLREINSRPFGSKDQVLFYFSSHGHYQASSDNGYFVPTDGPKNWDYGEGWLSYAKLRDYLGANRAQHILVALDACHSGAFGQRSRGRPGNLPWQQGADCQEVQRASLRRKSRLYFSSGNQDERTPAQSIFLSRWLQCLRELPERGQYLVTDTDLEQYVNTITLNSPQNGSFIGHEEGGSFVFIHKNACAPAPPIDRAADRAAWRTAEQANTLAAYRKYRADFPKGEFIPLVIARLEAAEREERAWDEAKRLNTRQAYDDFIGAYPNSDYRSMAEYNRGLLKTPEPARPATPIDRLEADMVRVAGDSFTMGCQSTSRDGDCFDWEKPPRTVLVPAFSIGKYEVTQAQWRAVMGSDPPELYNKGCDDCPVEGVSWNDIQDFLRKLNAQTGKRYRLPTEAEWEYAARGGAQSRGYLYSGSSNIDEVAWYSSNAKSGNTYGAEKTTRPVGQKKANELGLYDMSGNVREWCEDDWHSDYNGAPTDGRAWVDSPRASYRVNRGGSWNYLPQGCRAASRSNNAPASRNFNVGFRLAL